MKKLFFSIFNLTLFGLQSSVKLFSLRITNDETKQWKANFGIVFYIVNCFPWKSYLHWNRFTPYQTEPKCHSITLIQMDQMAYKRTTSSSQWCQHSAKIAIAWMWTLKEWRIMRVG